MLPTLLGIDLTSLPVGNGGLQATGIAQKAEIHLVDRIPCMRTDGIALRQIRIIRGIVVAAQIILTLAVSHGHRDIVVIRNAK